MFNPFSTSAEIRKVLAVSAVSALLVLASLVTEAKAADGWAVDSAEGKVTINGQVPGLPAPAIGPGTVIETGANGKVILMRPGDSITVYPNSRMSVPAAGGGEAGILQTLGKLLFRMESRESRDFEVKTPYLAAAIKGTTFTVEVDDDDAGVEVEEGSVLVTANRSGQAVYVGPGQRASVSRDSGDSVRVSSDRDDDGWERESEHEPEHESEHESEGGSDDSQDGGESEKDD